MERYRHGITIEDVECEAGAGGETGMEYIRKELLALLQPVAKRLYASKLINTEKAENMNYLAIEAAERSLARLVEQGLMDGFQQRVSEADIEELAGILECKEQLSNAGPAGLMRLMGSYGGAGPLAVNRGVGVGVGAGAKPSNHAVTRAYTALASKPRFQQLLDTLRRTGKKTTCLSR